MEAACPVGKTTMSNPPRVDNCTWCCLKLSLITLLIRFLPFALRQFLRDTAIPRRQFSMLFARYRTRKQRSVLSEGPENTKRKSPFVLNRTCRGNLMALDPWHSPKKALRQSGHVLPEPGACRADLILPNQAERRLRPLARRALIMARPPRVDMRARKPCRRARFKRLG